MRKLIFATLLTLCFVLTGIAQQGCKEYSAPVSFSICPPAAWVAKDEADNKYKQFFAEPVDGFAANINLKEVADPLSLNEAFTVMAIGTFPSDNSVYTNFRMVYLKDFVSSSGEKGIKTIYNFDFKGRSYASIHYLFAGTANLKVLLVATTLMGDTSSEKLADASIKTFKFKK